MSPALPSELLLCCVFSEAWPERPDRMPSGLPPPTVHLSGLAVQACPGQGSLTPNGGQNFLPEVTIKSRWTDL